MIEFGANYTKSGLATPVFVRVRQRAPRQRTEGKEGLSQTGCLKCGFGIRCVASLPSFDTPYSLLTKKSDRTLKI